jgi:transposase
MARYSKGIVTKITELISSDTYSIAEVCKLVGIATRTFYDWQTTKAEFAEAIQEAYKERTALFEAEAKKAYLKR